MYCTQLTQMMGLVEHSGGGDGGAGAGCALQSAQSVPAAHIANSEPMPPSSQSPSLAWAQVLSHVCASV
jgi:hypothetical protein